jgi:hypothetical protein
MFFSLDNKRIHRENMAQRTLSGNENVSQTEKNVVKKSEISAKVQSHKITTFLSIHIAITKGKSHETRIVLFIERIHNNC